MDFLLTFVLLATSSVNGLNPSYEQIATDYFFDSIWANKYLDYKEVEFKDKSDARVSAEYVYAGCMNWSDADKKQMQVGAIKEEVQLNCKLSNTAIKKYRRSKKLKVRVGYRIRLGDMFVVQIDVYKPQHFLDHYFIKLDSEGKIVDQCESSEII